MPLIVDVRQELSLRSVPQKNNDASLSKDYCFIVPGSLSQSDEGAHLRNCQIQMPTHQFKGVGEART